MKSDKLRIGILGCGPISQAAHIESCRKGRNVELYALCDAAEDLLYRVAEIHRPKFTYTNYGEMLPNNDIDAVIIGVSDFFHVSAAMKALKAGKHVLVEKPLGVTIEECLELEKVVKDSGLILQVGNMKRFDEGISTARDFVKNEMGEMLALKAWYGDNHARYTLTDNVMPIIERSDQSLKPARDVKGNKKQYYMLGHGSHLVDTARFFGGNILSVQAYHTEKFGAHNWLATVEFENGSYGQLDLSIGVRMDWHEGFQIYGEYGSVVGKTFNPWLFKSSEVDIFSAKDGQFRRPLASDGHFYRRQLEGFADTIIDRKPMTGASIEDGIANMRAMVAIAHSVESGERVKLSDVRGGL
ncbi:Gfo/Idh/MocA family protein [Lederbergia citrea]|uniref:Gfo/Idh/MocA family oxidoreductase n=1 Tax=Lederbergia citrea TaxID=2833581 RepID=A0A942UQR6_9BACI|nr:Gfo/Idh/MocA family oxidoreductase [Lederbergia citrea]MBS4204141.1 Gfo/Idh/MocA family oxidoreductase [Lederbergia citrea]MBS4221274.1 Gfo/Idh/MocA family oxidoreductase [Lederbergia citrea]